MSPRSIRRWRKYASVGRPLFSRFAAVLAQNSQIARAVKWLGAPNVITAGNLKIDSPPPPVNADTLAILRDAVGRRPLFLAASTHPGEDTVIAAAHSLIRRHVDGLLTIIVPRHPERGSGLAATLGGLGAQNAASHSLVGARERHGNLRRPTRSGSSEPSIRSRRSLSSAGRWSSTADKIRSRRCGSERAC